MQNEIIARNELLRLKALLMGREGMVARGYVIGKIECILSEGTIPLDSRNESVYRQILEEEQK